MPLWGELEPADARTPRKAEHQAWLFRNQNATHGRDPQGILSSGLHLGPA